MCVCVCERERERKRKRERESTRALARENERASERESARERETKRACVCVPTLWGVCSRCVSGGGGGGVAVYGWGQNSSQFENTFFTEMCSGCEAGSCLRLTDFAYH